MLNTCFPLFSESSENHWKLKEYLIRLAKNKPGWSYRSVISALGMLRQEDFKFKASLGVPASNLDHVMRVRRQKTKKQTV